MKHIVIPCRSISIVYHHQAQWQQTPEHRSADDVLLGFVGLDCFFGGGIKKSTLPFINADYRKT